MDTDEIERIIALRKQRKNYRQIAKEVQRSQETIRLVIKEHAPELKGDLLYPELFKAETFEKPDEVIAAELNLPVSSVAAARRKFSIGNTFSVNLARRRKSLANTLFDANPGPNFIKFLIHEVFPQLTPLQRALMENFYIQPLEESLAATNNFDSNRGYRTEIKAELAKKTQELNVSRLFKEGVLQRAKNRIKSNSSRRPSKVG